MVNLRLSTPLQARLTLSSVKQGMAIEPTPDFNELEELGLVEITGRKGISVTAKLTPTGEKYLRSL